MKKLSFLLLGALVGAFWIFAAPVSAASSSSLTVVSHEYVCMVNDRVFPNQQIPVQHAGKTYYGCCPMCKERLANDAAIRRAIDPVSGKSVDKADAVIGAKPNGEVFYFETIEHLKRYK